MLAGIHRNRNFDRSINPISTMGADCDDHITNPPTAFYTFQRCRWVFKSGWASSNVVGIICPLVVIGLTELPNSGWAKAHPAHLLGTSLRSRKTLLISLQVGSAFDSHF